MMPGVWSGAWRVTMKNQCALRGTSVVLKCSYDYPSRQTVREVGWFKESWNHGIWSLGPLPSSEHFVYIGNHWHDCTLKINDIRYADQGNYYFRFETNYNKWRSTFPAYISVKALSASVEPRTVTEGDDVTLTCQSGCDTQRNLPFVWFREGQRVSQPVFKASREDAGRYQCALLGQENVRSTSVTLNVLYAPKKVMLSVSSSKDIIQGSVVSFMCSSEANPLVAPSGYSLFKDGRSISSGPEHTITNVQPSDSGQYFCQAWNNITWEGNTFFNSTGTHLNVEYQPMNTSISMDSPDVIEGSGVTLTCNSDANPPAHDYTWYKRGPSSSYSPSSMVQVGSGPVLSLSSVNTSHSGHYMCQAWNRLGENNSTELLLSMKSKDTATYFPILAGIGVSLFVALVLALLLYWKKQRSHPDMKRTPLDPVLSGRGSSSPANVETSDHIYANNHMFQPHSTEDKEEVTCLEEVTYTTVNIKPKNRSHPHHKRTNAPETDDCVIYTTVAKFN